MKKFRVDLIVFLIHLKIKIKKKKKVASNFNLVQKEIQLLNFLNKKKILNLVVNLKFNMKIKQLSII